MKNDLRNIPGVDTLLERPEMKLLAESLSTELVVYSIRTVLEKLRVNFKNGNRIPELELIINDIAKIVSGITTNSLKRVINATGIILHTNFGRAPLGKEIYEEIKPIFSGYSNLEFDLYKGKRGKRNDHLIDIIKFLTGAEDALIVNNNAAAVSLIMRVFANGKEVIISRGELIEIGDSFRLPEIIESSNAKMIEIGTTNKTHISDYEKALTKNTSLILKAHKSNFYQKGFTEEVEISELSLLAKKNNIILVFDIGSGWLTKVKKIQFDNEPSVNESLIKGADLVTFSCDKLLGGPQAGIIAGNKSLITKLSCSPLFRTYRVCKITFAVLAAVMRRHLFEKDLYCEVPVYNMLNRSKELLYNFAKELCCNLIDFNVESTIIECEGYCGGGTLPNHKIDSYAVKLKNTKQDKHFAKNIYSNLLKAGIPIIGVLRKGEIHFNVLTLTEEEIPIVAKTISHSL